MMLFHSDSKSLALMRLALSRGVVIPAAMWMVKPFCRKILFFLVLLAVLGVLTVYAITAGTYDLTLWKVFRQLKREKPDIIHTHTAKAGTIGRTAGFLYRWLTPQTLIGKPRRVRFVHTYHGHVFHSYYGRAKTKFFLFIEKFLAR